MEQHQEVNATSPLTPDLKQLTPSPNLSFRAEQTDVFFFRVRSCERVGLCSRGISLRSLPGRPRLEFTLRFEGLCRIKREKSGVSTPEVGSGFSLVGGCRCRMRAVLGGRL